MPDHAEAATLSIDWSDAMKSAPRLALAIILIASSLLVAPAQAQTITTLGNFLNPTSVAVDGSGNSFVVDTVVGAVQEIPAPGHGTTISTLGTGTPAPWAIAVDGHGNVFGATSGLVYEVVATGGYATVRTLATGFNFASGIAVDGSGNVFVADLLNNTVSVILAVDGAIPASPQIVTIGSGFDRPYGVALDGSGNVYVTDSGNNAVKEILAASGYTTITTLGSGFNQPKGISIDGSGNLFVADTGNSAVKEILAAGGYTTVKSLGSEFTNALVGIAVDGSGNVFVADSGRPAVEEILASSGYGTVKMVGSGFTGPVAVATDGAGNVFVGDVGNEAITELVAAGNYAAKPIAGELAGPVAAALDPSGNLFVVDFAGTLKEMLVAGGYNQILPLASGFYQPQGVAVDRQGNVFVADTANSAIKELPASGGYATTIVLGSGFRFPSGVAVDGDGNVFVADSGNGMVKEMLAVDGSIPAAPTIRTLGSGFVLPTGLAIDGSGNVYVADADNRTLDEIMAAGGYSLVIPIPGGFSDPRGVTVDAGNNIFVADVEYHAPQPHEPPPVGWVYEISAAPPVLLAAVLPGARSVELGAAATIFATMLNSGPTAFDSCAIGLPASAPAGLSLSYQPTDPATNVPIGTPNTPVAIPGNNGTQTFFLSFQGSAAFSAPAMPLEFSCTSTDVTGVVTVAAAIPGVDVVDLTMSATPIADVIALVATPTHNGIIAVPTGGSSAFAIASYNLGVTAPITVSVDTGAATLPVTATICATDPGTGQCLATPAATVALNFASGTAPTFSVFLQSTGAIPFAPATSRVFVRFEDAGGGLHGSTSLAIESP
jgi:streptogramin lyase